MMSIDRIKIHGLTDPIIIQVKGLDGKPITSPKLNDVGFDREGRKVIFGRIDWFYTDD